MGIGTDLGSGISTVPSLGESGIIIPTTVSSAAPAIVTDSLLAWWRHNEGSGTVLGDSAGSLDGNIQGSGFWDNNGPDGNPVGTYDGTNNWVKDIGTGLAIPSGGMTLVMSFRTGVVPPAINRALLAKTDNSGPDRNYQLLVGGSTDELQFGFVSPVTGNEAWNTTNFNIVADTWYIATITYTFGTGSSIKVYRNTTLCTGSWAAGDGDELPSKTDQYVLLGALDNVGDGSGNVRHITGQEGDVMVYNKVLNITEITQNFNALKDRYSL